MLRDSIEKALREAGLEAEVHDEPDGACRVVVPANTDAKALVSALGVMRADGMTHSPFWLQPKATEFVVRGVPMPVAPDGPGDAA